MGSQGDRKRERRGGRIKFYVSHNRRKNRKYVYCIINEKRLYWGPLEEALKEVKKLLAEADPKEADIEVLKEKFLEDVRESLNILDEIIQALKYERFSEDMDIIEYLARRIVGAIAYFAITGKLGYGAHIVEFMLEYIVAFKNISKNWAVEKGRTCRSPGEALARRLYMDQRIDAFEEFYARIKRWLSLALEEAIGQVDRSVQTPAENSANF